MSAGWAAPADVSAGSWAAASTMSSTVSVATNSPPSSYRAI